MKVPPYELICSHGKEAVGTSSPKGSMIKSTACFSGFRLESLSLVVKLKLLFPGSILIYFIDIALPPIVYFLLLRRERKESKVP